MTQSRIFIGTYTKTTSQGIYSTILDRSTGDLAPPQLAARTANPTFLAFDPAKKHLYAVNGSAPMAVGFAIDPGTLALNALGQIPLESGPAPCHLAVDASGQALVLVNYHTGVVASLAIGVAGALGPPQVLTHVGHSVDKKRQSEPHPHSAVFSPDNKFAMVCDLGLDKVYSYALEPKGAHLTAAPPFTATPPGSGPRHSVFSPDRKHFYVVTEIASTVLAFAYKAADASLAILAQYSALPAGCIQENKSAEICMHPSGNYIYVSNRGHDSIAIFSRDSASGKLTLATHVPCGGHGPRSFALTADGAWLVCANENSNNLAAFKVENEGADLQRRGGEIAVPQPVCVAIFD